MARRKRKKSKPRRRRPAVGGDLPTWMEDDGCHTLLPGTPPDQPTLDRLTKRYQQQIRNSPLWDEMVREFGLQKAEQLLREFRAELR